MLFSGIPFLYYFLPVVLLVYYLVPLHLRNGVLLVFNLIFYGWGERVYIWLMVATILIDYLAGILVARAKKKDRPRAAKRWLIAAIAVNLALLGFFKYADFILDNLRLIPALSDLPRVGLALPIGISFYTFQALSYVIDVYRGEVDAQRSAVKFGTYVTLFPQLIAGPIVRYQDVDDQLRSRKHSTELFASGVRTLAAGMGKKVLLANAAGEIWSRISEAPETTVAAAWLGIIMYTFQIYFDFSGYSDMAIGLGKMMGFSFRENFYYPYMAASVTDFWRRWHISLSTWFREYVYIPLGGNRRGWGRQILNLLAVWFLTGLWHGASWNFVLWGLYYFVLLMLEKTFLLKLLDKLPRFISHVYTLITVVFGWLLFVSTDFASGMEYLATMFGFGRATAFIDVGGAFDWISSLILLLILVIASTPYPKKLLYKLWEKYDAPVRAVTAILCLLVFFIAVAYLVNSSYNPFLYYRF